MAVQEKVTESISKYVSIPSEKADGERRFYYKTYEDNLYCTLGELALKAYDDGKGAETRPTERKYKGKTVMIPAKMASIVSSSAMTFNLLGNDAVTVSKGSIIPLGKYDVQYEKQMYTIKIARSPANLDAFLSNKSEKTAVFCEMKFLEWLGTPGTLKDTYLDKSYFFKQNNTAVPYTMDAYEVFKEVIEKLTKETKIVLDENKKKEREIYYSIYTQYDAWQMLKHLLAIYNYTSIVTKEAVDTFGKFPSMAGDYNRILLLNVVNEFPVECVEDDKARAEYEKNMKKEQEEARKFIEIINNSQIPQLFENNCNAKIEIKYVSAKEFAEAIEMSEDKRNYLKRYFT